MRGKKAGQDVFGTKTLSAVCMVVLIIVGSILFQGQLSIKTVQAASEDEQVSAPKKIVSIVFDDSPSMEHNDDSWAAANYALQAFAALMNEKDEMYITYMSDHYSKEHKDRTIAVDLSDVTSAVDEIKNHVEWSDNTPLQSVVTAYNTLKNVKETKENKNENTQYWLVIMTDGQFNDKKNDTKYTDVQSLLNHYKGTTMLNGSQIQIKFMGIGTSAEQISDDIDNGLQQYQSTDIIDTLQEIANKVSGRYEFSEDDNLKKTGDNTIQVHLDIPVYNIAVFNQTTKASVTAVAGEDVNGNKVNLTVDRNINLFYPSQALGMTVNYDGINETLKIRDKKTENYYGVSSMITNGIHVIEPGDYTIKFSDSISLEQMTVMYQPAIEMFYNVYKDGIQIDPNTLVEEDEITLELIARNPETKTEIQPRYLPEGVVWKVSVTQTVDDKESTKVYEDRQVSGIVIQKGYNEIVCSMQVPDFAPIRSVITIEPQEPRNLGLLTNQTNPVYRVDKLTADAVDDPVSYQITEDDEILTGAALDGAEVRVADDIEIEASNFLMEIWNKLPFTTTAVPVVEKQEDGSFILYPSGGSRFDLALTRTGTYTMSVYVNQDNNVRSAASFQIQAPWIIYARFGAKAAGFLCVLFYMIHLIRKPKFHNQEYVIKVYRKSEQGRKKWVLRPGKREEGKLHPFHPQLLLFGRMKQKDKSGYNILFELDDVGDVILTEKTLQHFEGYHIGRDEPLRKFNISMEPVKVKKKRQEESMNVDLSGRIVYLLANSYLYEIKVDA